jgi:hypothetical protein
MLKTRKLYLFGEICDGLYECMGEGGGKCRVMGEMGTKILDVRESYRILDILLLNAENTKTIPSCALVPMITGMFRDLKVLIASIGCTTEILVRGPWPPMTTMIIIMMMVMMMMIIMMIMMIMTMMIIIHLYLKIHISIYGSFMRYHLWFLFGSSCLLYINTCVCI